MSMKETQCYLETPVNLLELAQLTNKSMIAIRGNRGMPVAAGGIIVKENLDVETDLVGGSEAMRRKFTLVGPGDWKSGLSINGARIGIAVGPEDLTDNLLREVIDLLACRLSTNLGTAASVGISAAQLSRAIERIVPHPQFGVIKGLGLNPVSAEGNFALIFDEFDHPITEISPRHQHLADVLTGFAAAHALQTLEECQGKSLVGKKVAVHGFGAVGGSMAFELEQFEAKITCIANTSGVFDCAHFEITIPLSQLDNGARLRPETSTLPLVSKNPEDLLRADTDILVLAAQSHTITAENWSQIRAPLVVELANIAVAPAAIELLERNEKVIVIPYEVINGGNATAYTSAAMGPSFQHPQDILEVTETHLSWLMKRCWEISQKNQCDLSQAVDHMVEKGNLWTNLLTYF